MIKLWIAIFVLLQISISISYAHKLIWLAICLTILQLLVVITLAGGWKYDEYNGQRE